jgi:hypothetical protein
VILSLMLWNPLIFHRIKQEFLTLTSWTTKLYWIWLKFTFPAPWKNALLVFETDYSPTYLWASLFHLATLPRYTLQADSTQSNFLQKILDSWDKNRLPLIWLQVTLSIPFLEFLKLVISIYLTDFLFPCL